MICRRIATGELPDLLRLFAFLHPTAPTMHPDDAAVRRIWDEMLADGKQICFVAEEAGRIVSTCTLVVVPNLTRGPRPYGLIENVVTDPEFRKRGIGTAVLRHALAAAWEAGCYKVMLATGSKRESTLRFYEQAGFLRGVKTGFVAHPPA